MYLVGDALSEIVLFLPNSSLNRLRHINLVFLQAIRRRIAQLSPSALMTIPICELKKMADNENKLDALKSEMTNIKEDIKKGDGGIGAAMFGALAVMSVLLEKLTGDSFHPFGIAGGLDYPFNIPFSSIGAMNAAYKNICREIYEDEPDEQAGLVNEDGVRDAINYCTDEGMLNKRFDGYYQFAPHTEWKSFKQRQERDDGH